MIEVLLLILLLATAALLFLQFQNKGSGGTNIKFEASLDEKIKLIHDIINTGFKVLLQL